MLQVEAYSGYTAGHVDDKANDGDVTAAVALFHKYFHRFFNALAGRPVRLSRSQLQEGSALSPS